jgi:hypothetical protein
MLMIRIFAFDLMIHKEEKERGTWTSSPRREASKFHLLEELG